MEIKVGPFVQGGEEVSEEHGQDTQSKLEVEEILTQFCQKLTDCGYDGLRREEIIKSGVRKDYRGLAKAMREDTSIYQMREEMREKKEMLILLNKPWF